MATNEELQDEPTADLLRRLTDQTSTLIRQEMELARVELQQNPAPSVPRRGSGPTALFGLGATGAFVAGVILALATVIEAWVAAFGVALVLALAAVLAAAAERARPAPVAEAPAMDDEQVVLEPPDQDFETESEVIAVYAQNQRDHAREDDFRG